MSTPRFANILLSGPCNLRCPACIGRQLGPAQPSNLDRFPLAGMERFLRLLRAQAITQVSLTGADTDPLLYRHTAALLVQLRRELPGVQISLHSNGLLALHRLEVFNAFDRATISFPSFSSMTYRAMTGRARPLDLAALLASAEIPIKVSVLLTEHNRAELGELLERCAGLGLRRLVLRAPYGDRAFKDPLAHLTPARRFGGNPVYQLAEMEVTVWDFARSRLDCVNLFSDGRVSEDYLLSAARRAAPGGVVADAA
jgi:molybdenum cofactor biosynthesis enzyme MoaA